jgi:hypothetical protein
LVSPSSAGGGIGFTSLMRHSRKVNYKEYTNA